MLQMLRRDRPATAPEALQICSCLLKPQSPAPFDTQAEAVSQLVEARTAAAADAALAGLSGGLAACVASLRADAIDLLVHFSITGICGLKTALSGWKNSCDPAQVQLGEELGLKNTLLSHSGMFTHMHLPTGWTAMGAGGAGSTAGL